MLLKQKRRELNLTHSQLEQMLNLKHTTVSKWESGIGYPRAETILELEEILGLSASEIIKDIKQEKRRRAG